MSADILLGDDGASLNTTLTQREREYLQAVLAPLPAVRYVRKCTVSAAKERLLIDFRDSNVPLTFPPFRTGALYAGMRTDHLYRPQDLGLSLPPRGRCTIRAGSSTVKGVLEKGLCRKQEKISARRRGREIL